MRLEAVIFDMDGLLIDSEPLWRLAEREVFAAVGLELTDEDCRGTTGLRSDDGTVSDGQVPGNPGLSCQNGVFTDGHATGDTDLGNQDGIFVDNNIVGNMYEIVGLNPSPDMGFAEGSPVYGIIGPNFNIIIDLNDARVRNFVIAFAVGSKTKAITANH